jgi:hypothetical protein
MLRKIRRLKNIVFPKISEFAIRKGWYRYSSDTGIEMMVYNMKRTDYVRRKSECIFTITYEGFSSNYIGYWLEQEFGISTNGNNKLSIEGIDFA